jgi:glycosyltransferase involved in cell wall biosynthesis
METLSILIMNWRDIHHPAAGGAEVFTHEVATRWATAGHDVTLLTSRFEDAQKEEVIEGVKVIRRGNRFTVYGCAKEAYLHELKGRNDVVIDEINTRPFLTPRYVNGETHLFALIHQLAREFWSYETPFPVSIVGRYLLEDYWLRQYADVPTLTVSPSTEADLKRLGFRDIGVVQEGLSFKPPSHIPEKQEWPTLIFLGRLRRAKLPEQALKAFSSIKNRVPSAVLWVVGGGYLRRRLEKIAPPGVIFFGRVSAQAKQELLSRAHVLLVPAVREGWGLSILEASALGTPAVGYRVQGVKDAIVDGITGFTVPFGDTDELATAAMQILEDDTLRNRMASACILRAQQFDWGTTAAQMLDFIRARL